MNRSRLLLALLLGPALAARGEDQPLPSPADYPSAYNEVWTTPSKDATGSMPLGNGQAGVNLWAQENGEVRLYVSRNDSFSEMSRLLKVGGLHLSFTPNPFASGSPFRQELALRDGVCRISGGQPGHELKIRVYVDPERPVIHVTGEAPDGVEVKASIDSWRSQPHKIEKGNKPTNNEETSAFSIAGAPFPLIESADVFLTNTPGGIGWYHRNETSRPFAETLKLQSLTNFTDKIADPLLNRTFGGWMTATNLVPADGGMALRSEGPVKNFDLRIAAPCLQTARAEDWLAEAKKDADASADAADTLKRTTAWWNSFWDRSYIITDPAKPELFKIARSYALQRYMQACGGRGPMPIKFNGGMFTVEPTAMDRPFNPDYRLWGDAFWWQNTRHMYHPMAASGDLEMTSPLFDMYEKVIPLAEARTGLYHGARGAYFPECMTFWGTYPNPDFSWNRSGLKPYEVRSQWWRYAWNQGPELVSLMLDRWDYERDTPFLQKQVVPMAKSVLTYFDTRFPKDASGKIIIDPTQSAETYWYNVTNDMPAVACLTDITTRLTALPQNLTSPEDRAFFSHMKAAIPEVPVETVQANGKTLRKLAPAQSYKPTCRNCENTDLYAVWPARVATLDTPLLEEARVSYERRRNKLPVGWGYDGNVAALLGLSDEAARILALKCANSHPAYRWPATWGPNFDWLPDQNHGGNLLMTTQLMLLQAAGDKIRLLPAWPKDWDVRFKLHAPAQTTVEATVIGGKITQLKVTPESRRKDIITNPAFTGPSPAAP
jgi:hypothetical protein